MGVKTIGDKMQSHNLTQNARLLRKQSTDTEKLLWSRLRAKQIISCKFRRQQPIGNYIVDFVCFSEKLIIELDGGQHAIQKNKDKERDNWLCKEGFTVLRFWNNEVIENLEGVLDVISRHLMSPSP